MNLESIKSLIGSKTARPLLLAQKHSPKILFIAGTVGVIGTVVLACRATLKTVEVMNEHERAASKVKAKVEGHNQFETLSVEDGNQQIHKLQVNTALRIARDYAPAIGLGALSIGALSGSHIILSRRNGALMATAAGLGRAYQEYRKRVVEEYGEDIDERFAIGAKNVDVEEKLADGSTKITKSEKIDKDSKSGSPYRFLFDPVNAKKWSREPGRNAMTLVMEQSHANDKLKANGHLFLNEVFDLLAMPRTKVGAVVGWVYRHDSEEKTGDNYVDFGIYRTDLERAEAFVDGAEDSVWLDFNVDGVILDLI